MKLYLLAALSLMVIGCASNGPKIDAARLSEIRKGETTVADVVSRFGRPSILSKNMSGTQTAVYMYAEGRSDATAFVSLVGALSGSANANVDSVIFHFDVNGVLSDYKITQADAPKPELANAEKATQTDPNKPTPTEPNKPTPTAKRSSSGNSNPWAIQLYPSGYKENRP
jgi:hypothetical protein